LGTSLTPVPQWHNHRDRWVTSVLCISTHSGYRIPALVSNPWTCSDLPITRVLWSNMPTWFQRPACNFSQSSSVVSQWPGNCSANMVHRTSSGQCLEDLRPCFTHMRQNARSDDFAAVDRSGKRLLHSDFGKLSHNPSSACRMSPWCSSTLCGHVGGYGSRSKRPGTHQ
jgi:hypothetical protein